MPSSLSRILAASLPALILSVCPLSAADGWMDDFAKAKESAAKENRDLLMDFTGSDWCGWCIQLHTEVFGTDAFKREAPKHFVLVEIDFPQEKQQSAALKTQNEKLQKDYSIEEFPTLVLADAMGRPYATIGYEEGGPAKYLERLGKLRKIRESRDSAFKKAAAAEGTEKAKWIMQGLKDVSPELIHGFYKAEIEAAIAADRDDLSGAKKSRDAFAREKAYQEKFAALDEELSALHEAEKFDAFAARVDKFIADEKLEGTRRQEALMIKLAVFGPDKLGESLKLLDEVIKVDPKSEMSEQAKMMKENLKEMTEQIEKSKKAEPDTGEAGEKEESDDNEKPGK